MLKFINRNSEKINKKSVNKSLKTSTSNQIQSKFKLEVSSLFIADKGSFDTSKSILSYILYYISKVGPSHSGLHLDGDHS